MVQLNIIKSYVLDINKDNKDKIKPSDLKWTEIIFYNQTRTKFNIFFIIVKDKFTYEIIVPRTSKYSKYTLHVW